MTDLLPPPTPDVIVDFTCERGILHVAVVNTSAASAYRVSTQFDASFRGLGGKVELSSLPLFRRIEFLAPNKRIETLVDTTAAWFARDEPTIIGATVTWHDEQHRAYERRIVHDLSIYRDLAWIVAPGDSCAAASTPPSPSSITITGSVRHVGLPR